MSKYKEFLKSIGVDTKTINAIEKAETDKADDFDVKTLADEFASHQRKLFENDPDLVTNIAAKEKGKQLDIATRAIKKIFNLSADAIKDKSFEEVVAIAKTEATKSTDKTLQEIQQELTEANAKLKDYEDVQIPKIKSEVENEKKQFKINNKLNEMLPKSDDLRVPVKTVSRILNDDLNAQFDVDLDDDGNVIMFVKGKRLQPKSADGTKLLTPFEIVANILKENQFIKESNADDGKGEQKKQTVVVKDEKKEEDNKPKPPHLNAAQQHLENLRKQKEQKAA